MPGGSDWDFSDGQAGPCMGRCMGGCMAGGVVNDLRCWVGLDLIIGGPGVALMGSFLGCPYMKWEIFYK